MKRLILLLSALLFVLGLSAAPHSFLPTQITQPDGSQLTIYASGDEFHNWLHDEDNYTIVKDDDGWYVYAMQNGENVAPTQLKIGKELPHRSLNPGINLSQRLIDEKYERLSAMRDYSNARSPHTGEFHNLVVFIRFSDSPDFMNDISFYDAMFNDSTPNANSMRNYFIAASYNQLEMESFFFPPPNGQTIVSYVDSHPRAYYSPVSGSNPIGYDPNDYWERTDREHTLLANAIAHIANMIPSNVILDGDNDGYVDNVCFIIQGATDGWAELLWPHRWVLYGVDSYIQGAQVWDFNFQLENSLQSSGASVLSHEMFHSLGAPDLYRYSDNTITPIGNWDLMAGNASPPQHMSVWMKYRYGEWLPQPPAITQSGTYTLHPVASSSTNNAYRVASWKTGEQYVLEYRKGYGIYDNNLPGSGLLVYRLISSVNGNADGPPDELYLYRPGGVNTTTNGYLNQAHYSEQTGRTMITEATPITGFTSNDRSGGLNLYNIGFAGDTITFDIKISNIQLISPGAGEEWLSGTNKAIRWASKNTYSTVKLEYSADGGNSWNLIANNVNNQGSYTWTNIPMIDSDNCYIRITQNSDNHSDTSTFPFTIYSSVGIPQIIYPANGETAVPTNPRLEWAEATGATGYDLQVSPTESFSANIVDIIDHQDNFYELTQLRPFTQYFWRVASRNEYVSTNYSPIHSFTTGSLSEVPDIPNLLLPAHLATNQPLNPFFKWQLAALAESYRLQVGTSPYFTQAIIDIEDIEADHIQLEGTPLNPNSTYYWRVASKNSYSSSAFSLARRFTTGNWVANEDEHAPALVNKLNQNFPNPFNPTTTISFTVKEMDKEVKLDIFNSKGQRVRRLYKGLPNANEMSLVFDGKDDLGRALSSGIYLYRLRTAEFSETRKMLLNK